MVAVATAAAAMSGCGGSDGGGGTPPVTPSGVASLVLTNAGSDSLASLRDSLRLTATARDAAGGVVGSAAITWISRDPSVATVSATGGSSATIVAVSGGTATISATSGSATATRLIVVAQRAASLTIAATPDTLYAIGDSKTLTAAARDAGGSAIPGASAQWSVDRGGVVGLSASAGPSVVASALAAGSATVSATIGGLSATAVVPVRQRVAQVVVSPSSASLAVNATASLAVAGKDARGAVVPNLAAPRFASSDTTRAKVSAAGVVTGIAAGTTTIAVTQPTADGDVRASVPVTVTAAAFPIDVSVNVQDFQFAPGSVEVAAGGRVTWTWQGSSFHDVTGSGTSSFIRGPLQAQGTYVLTFSTPGTFSYLCTQHPFMTGTVVVH